MQGRSLAIWTFAVTSVALVMVMLDCGAMSKINTLHHKMVASIFHCFGDICFHLQQSNPNFESIRWVPG